jgi:hypothetical protein
MIAPIDITTHEDTRIDFELRMIEFKFTIDDINRYCYKIWDQS